MTVARFTVCARGQRLHVRLVADCAAVHRAWRSGSLGRLARGEQLHGFFCAQQRGALGEVVLAGSTALREIVPHECAHAAVAALRRRHGLARDAAVPLDAEAEEYVATLAGLLTRSVFRQLALRGVEVR